VWHVKARLGAIMGALLLSAAPAAAHAQVFLSSEPHPEFGIGPLFIAATVTPDLVPVTVRVSWSVALPPPSRSTRGVGQPLYLLWPGEVVTPSPAATSAEPTLVRHVQERGFTVVTAGQLALEARDRTKLGTLAAGQPLPHSASFVTFYKTGTTPAQSGVGTFIKVPWTAALTDTDSLISLQLTVRDMITPKPATWVEELFWGRRQILTLSAGSAGSLALYSLYFDQRDRVVFLARDFSLLVAAFSDADHLRVEEINPASASRRPSRLRAGTETVSLPIGAAEGTVPQTLKVHFAYFSGPFAWRPIVVSVVLLALGNLMGAFMFAQQINRFVRGRFHMERAGEQSLRGLPPPDVLARLTPGSTTQDEALALCGPPVELRERRHSPTVRTLIYRDVQWMPHCRWRVGRLATVSRWDEEHHEIQITVENDRVRDVQTRVRRARPG
jgi:hypothetical protein